MSNSIQNVLDNFRGNAGASPDILRELVENAGLRFPSDYLEFMAKMNGGEGFIGKHYLIMWRAEELLSHNRDYQVSEYAPGILLFASSGGGEGFGYDTRNDKLPIVQVPFVGLDLRHAKRVADNFTELLVKMKASDGSLF